MALYEHVFLARQDISPQQIEALTDTFKGVIEEGGGSISKSEYWGLKSLTYRIKKNRKAHFTLLNIDAPSDALAEMERQMGINDDIIRHMTIRVDDHEEGPSAMMRSRGGRDRDDRRGRRDDRRDGEARSESPPQDKTAPAGEAAADQEAANGDSAAVATESESEE